MAERLQQESGEERVTAKSRLMMNLTARMPSIVSSSVSSNPVKTWYGYQDPGNSVVVDDRSGQPDRTSWNEVQQVRSHYENLSRRRCAIRKVRREMIHDGSGQFDGADYEEEADSETFVMGSDAAEFVNKVKDQVRKRQKRMSNVADSGEEHSIIRGMFMAATMNAATFMGKNFMDSQPSILNSTDLTLKKMFDITSKLVSEQEEINNLDKIHWEKFMEKFTSSHILCCALEGSISILNPTKLGSRGLNGSRLTKATETMTESMESRPSSSGIFSQDSLRCSSAVMSQIY